MGNDLFATAAILGDPFKQAALLSEVVESRPTASFGFGGSLGGRQTVIGNLYDGEKFLGGLGPARLNIPDYWTLRLRSSQLFTENLYARGLIRRLVTNEINTGLMLEAEPISDLLASLSEEGAEKWSETVEERFEIWSVTPALCDYEGRRTFSQLQAEARREALVEGDVLVRLHVSRTTGLPAIQLIRGGRVRTPLGGTPQPGNRIIHGIEMDERGREIAFHVIDDHGVGGLNLQNSTRVPAIGTRTGRRMAWLVYGTDRRMDAVRGEPLLSLILQSLKEMDRYRDSEQRAAVINSLLAMFMEKKEDKPGTRAFSGGAVRNVSVQSTGTEGETREFNLAEQVPGVFFEELQQGEIPHSFDTKRPNVDYGAFEAAVIQAIAWASEIPPEILMLQFSNNYSASKAAINEFKAYLTMVRKDFGVSFCSPIYIEWLVGEVLQNEIQAPGFLESRRTARGYVVFGAWSRSTWSGPVKPSVDLGKDVKAYMVAIEENLVTKDRASKDLFGVRYSTVLRRRLKEIRQEREMNTMLGINNDPGFVAPKPMPEPFTDDQRNTITELALEAYEEEISNGENSRLTH